MNIAFFTDAYWPRVNGVSVSVDSFARALVKAGHRVMIVCPEYPRQSAVNSGGASEPLVLRLPSNGVFFSKEDRAVKGSSWAPFENALKTFQPDIIHVNTEFGVALFGYRYAKKYGVPVVYTYHTIWEKYIKNYFPLVPDFLLQMFVKNYQRFLLKHADLFIVPTPQIGEMIKTYGVKRETRLLPTGIDPELFRHDAEEKAAFRKKLDEKYPVLRGKRILIFAGRVVKEKNLGFIISMMKDLREKHPEIILLIAGGGPDLDFYKKEAAAHNAADICVFPGYLERSELSLYYAVSDIFVFPSLTETQGLVTIEAMLSGIPVVAIGVRGTVQVMGGDNGGFMVPNDPDIFRERVLQLLEDDKLYRAKVLEAAAHARRWTLDTLTEKLLGIYREVPAIMTQNRKKAGNREI